MLTAAPASDVARENLAHLQDLQQPFWSVVSVPCRTGRDGSSVRQQEGRVLLGLSKSTHRFTVQRVVWRTSGLGLLGDELSIDVLTGVMHTLVIRTHVGVVNLWKWTIKHDSSHSSSSYSSIRWLPGNCKVNLLTFQKREGRSAPGEHGWCCQGW